MPSAQTPATSSVFRYAILLLVLLSTYQAVAVSSTNTTVTSSQSAITLGDTVTFTATVTTASGTPTGLVTFFDGANPLGSGTLAVVGGSDQATFATSLLSASGSPHSITATYQGDTNFASSTSAAISETVNPRTSTTSLALNPTTVAVGQPSSATVTVTDGGSSAPPGTADMFSPTGAPATSRSGFTATLFADGQVLVAGGAPTTILTLTQVAVGSNAVYSYSSFTGPAPAVGMSVAFSGFANDGNNVTATLTAVSGGASGTVTVALTTQVNETHAGSGTGTTAAVNTAEIYSVSSAAFTATGSLNTARTGAVAVLLPNGKILVAGGSSDGTPDGALNSAELFDPNTGTFTTTGNMNAARFGAIATLLNNGQVLVAGGGNSGGFLNSAELYNPATGTFTTTGNMTTARPGASATLLGSGKVLVAGGSGTGDAEGALSSAELFDPTAGTFTGIASTLSVPRWEPAAALLLSGKVLIAGGQNPGSSLNSADLYDPVANTFSASADHMAHARVNGSAVALPNGTVLLAGGVTPASKVAELYDADGDAFDATGSMQQSDNSLVATLLNDGDVLIVGLTTGNTSDAELYSPSFNPLGTVGFSSSEGTDTFGSPCVLAPSSGSSTASVCTSTVTATNVATSPHTITSTYPADAVHSSSNNTASLTVNPATTTTTVSSSLNPSGNGQSVTFTATVTNNDGSAAAPTGAVQFVVDGSNFGSLVTLTPASSNSSTAVSQSTSTLTVGTHSVTANYVNADGNFTNSSGTLSGGQVVNNTTLAPPTIAKAFNPGGIQPHGVSTLTITLTNPSANTAALTGVAFTDNFPANVSVATPNGLSNTCGGTATAGSNSVSLSGGTIAISGSCAVTVNVTSQFTGSYLNTTGAVNSNEGGTGGTASATLGVAFPPTISKLFLPDTINQGQQTLLSFTIENPNSNSSFPNSDVTLTGIAFTDNLPAGLVIANPNQLSNSCDGTVTADPGSSTVILSGGDLGPAVGLSRIKHGHSRGGLQQPSSSGSCFISVEVQPNTSGTFNNTTGAISANESGTGATSNTATLTVSSAPSVQPPTIAKAFGASSVPLNGTTTLTLTVGNPNSGTTLNNVGADDPLPSGLVVATPSGVSGSCLANGGSVISNTPTDFMTQGATLAPNTSCTYTINVTGTTAGTKNNTTGNVGADFNSGSETVHTTGGTASASLIVVAPPSIAKAFNPSSIAQTEPTSLVFTITNPAVNPVALTGVGFTDVLPSSLTVANGTSTVCGGTLTTSGGNTISLSGATIAVNSNCTFSVTISATTNGTFTNTTGNVTSGNGGTGNTAISTLTVVPVVITPPSVNFGDVDSNQSATTTVTIANNGNTPVSLSISLTPGTGTSANKFTFSTKCPTSLLAHTSCTVTVTFTAPNVTSTSQLGVSTATLNVASQSFTQHVPLSANVIDPEPQFTPASLSFGSHTVNSSTTLTTTLKNVGLTALNITGFTITGNQPGDFSQTNNCPASLAVGNSCTINVTFTPKATGNRDAKLNLIANDEAEFVPLTGSGH